MTEFLNFTIFNNAKLRKKFRILQFFFCKKAKARFPHIFSRQIIRFLHGKVSKFFRRRSGVKPSNWSDIKKTAVYRKKNRIFAVPICAKSDASGTVQ